MIAGHSVAALQKSGFPDIFELTTSGHSTLGIDDLTDRLSRDGFAGPIPLLTLEECAEIVAHEKSGLARDGLDWRKGRAASDPFYARLAADKRFIDLMRPL